MTTTNDTQWMDGWMEKKTRYSFVDTLSALTISAVRYHLLGSEFVLISLDEETDSKTSP